MNQIMGEFEGLALGAFENTTVITDQTKHHINWTKLASHLKKEHDWTDLNS